jgi:hypothetical protein
MLGPQPRESELWSARSSGAPVVSDGRRASWRGKTNPWAKGVGADLLELGCTEGGEVGREGGLVPSQVFHFLSFFFSFLVSFIPKLMYNSKTSVWTEISTYIIFFHIIIKIFLSPFLSNLTYFQIVDYNSCLKFKFRY